jgi:hypothetical protein
MNQIYNKYLLTEGLDSKSKRTVLKLISEPSGKKIDKIKINGVDVTVTFQNKKDLYFEYNKNLVELTKFLTDTIDDIKDKKFEAKEKGENMSFHITNK